MITRSAFCNNFPAPSFFLVGGIRCDFLGNGILVGFLLATVTRFASRVGAHGRDPRRNFRHGGRRVGEWDDRPGSAIKFQP